MNFKLNLNICRVCVKAAEQRQSLLNDEDLKHKFQYTTHLKLTENDNMPTDICGLCARRLRVAYSFVQTAIVSDNNLKAFLTKINNDFQQVTQSTTDCDTFLTDAVDIEETLNESVTFNIPKIDPDKKTKVLPPQVCVASIKHEINYMKKSPPLLKIVNKFEEVGAETEAEADTERVEDQAQVSVSNYEDDFDQTIDSTEYVIYEPMTPSITAPLSHDDRMYELERLGETNMESGSVKDGQLCVKKDEYRSPALSRKVKNKFQLDIEDSGVMDATVQDAQHDDGDDDDMLGQNCDGYLKEYENMLQVIDNDRHLLNTIDLINENSAAESTASVALSIKRQLEDSTSTVAGEEGEEREQIFDSETESAITDLIENRQTSTLFVTNNDDICDNNEITLNSSSITSGNTFEDHSAGALKSTKVNTYLKSKKFQTPSSTQVTAKPITHKRKQHSASINSASNSNQTNTNQHTAPTPPHRYWCEKCNRDFSTKTNLTRHLLTHEGNKPYHCEFCGKGFTQNGSLKQHIYIHTGEKPFVCDICDRGFTQCKSLVCHMRRHTGDKPFFCEICGTHFRQKDGLKAHILKHHAVTKQNGVTTQNVCTICEKDLGDIYAFKAHMKIHINNHNSNSWDTFDFTCEISDKDDEQAKSEGGINVSGGASTKTPPVSKFLTDVIAKSQTHADGGDSQYGAVLEPTYIDQKIDIKTSAHIIDVMATSAAEPHRAKKFQCRKCFKCFAIKRNLIHHLAIHNKMPPQTAIEVLHHCPACKMTFETVDLLKLHLVHEHAEQYGHALFNECEICNKIFNNADDYALHLSTKHAEMQTCTECPNLTFDSQKKLLEHMLQQHLDNDSNLENCK